MTPRRSTAYSALIRVPAPILTAPLVLLATSGCSFSTFGLEADTTSSTSSTGAAPGTSAATTTTGEPAATTTTGEPSTGSEAPTSTSASGSTSSTSDTSDTSTTGAPVCMGEMVESPICGDATPYCIDMTCVGCEQLSSCQDLDPGKPLCKVESGRCVECITDDHCDAPDKPICDGEMGTCGPCTEHEHCPTTACNLETGACFPTDNILYVYNDFNDCSDAKPGYGLTPGQPLCNLGAALKQAVVNEPLTIKVRSSPTPQKVPAGLPTGAFIVAIVPQDLPYTRLLKSTHDYPALALSSGNEVFMLQIDIHTAPGISGPAIQCSGASLWLDRQNIFDNDVAIAADDCLLRLRRTVIFSNTGGGINIEGSDPAKATLWLENSYVTENHGNELGGLRLGGHASAKILYSTIALNQGVYPPISCAPGWSGALELRNSALVDTSPRIDGACNGKEVKTNTYEAAASNTLDLQRTTFGTFKEGVYTAIEGGPLMDQALWLPGDPAADYDATPRPAAISLDYAGADRPDL